MNILCTICARSNSQGVKNKNFRPLNRKPLIYYTINQAIKSKIFSDIIISSDSEKILKYSRRFGLKTIFKRPKNLSNNKSPKVPVIQHALVKSEKYFKKKYDIIIDLDVSSPLRNITDIKNSFKFFKNQNASILLSGCVSRKNPYYNIIEIKKNKIKRVKLMKKKIFRRQDAPKTYDLNAAIYIWKRKSLVNFKSFYDKKTVLYEMPQKRSFDIDSETDFKIAETLLKINEKKLSK
tara:strand:+ start:436 stop:1143 length:708 start_codon:yes stop_codon:yes gene_type:complete